MYNCLNDVSIQNYSNNLLAFEGYRLLRSFGTTWSIVLLGTLNIINTDLKIHKNNHIMPGNTNAGKIKTLVRIWKENNFHPNLIVFMLCQTLFE